MSAKRTPAGASRLRLIPMTTSRRINKSRSKANVSSVRLTVPSMAFSIGTNPTSASPSATACSTSGIDTVGRNCPCARSVCVNKACSVKVPAGPRKATTGRAGNADEAMNGEDSDVDEASLHRLIADVAAGRVLPDDAVASLRRLPFADLGHTKVDHHRAVRQGLPEAVYAPGKTPDQCAEIVAELLAHGSGPVVLSRADDAQAAAAMAANPGARRHGATLVWRRAERRSATVAIVTAGTADLPVADECATILDAHGLEARRVSDVGV